MLNVSERPWVRSILSAPTSADWTAGAEAAKAGEDRMNADLRRPGEDHRTDDGAFTDRPQREDGDNVMQDRRMPSSHPERRTDGGFHEDFGFRRH